jgi:hypothetical protein
MREGADEHHTSVYYLHVILQNKVHLGALPQPLYEILTFGISISKTPRYLWVLVAYLNSLRASQADSRESPRTI